MVGVCGHSFLMLCQVLTGQEGINGHRGAMRLYFLVYCVLMMSQKEV